jgi:hypothetical protein
VWRGADPSTGEDPSDGAQPDAVAEPEQFALDTFVAPPRVLGGQPVVAGEWCDDPFTRPVHASGDLDKRA